MDPLSAGGAAWLRAEFTDAELGDKRRTKRLAEVAAGMAENPRGTIHGSLPTWAESKGAYRLLDRPEVTHEAVLTVHREHTVERCQMAAEVLLIEDTSTLNYNTHTATKGLGRIGDDSSQGLHLHSTLACAVQGWAEDGEPQVIALGLLDQHCWARSMPTVGRGKEKRYSRWKRARESERWAATFTTRGGPPAGARWTYIADRESDVYEAPLKCKAAGVDFIIRANQARALEAQGGSLFDAVAAAPVLGYFELGLRARPGQRARRAKVEVRAVSVTLSGPKRPGGRLPPLAVNLVQAREVEAPPDVKEPIQWVLLTSWPITDFVCALRVVKTYARRWLIEEFHKALKSGAGVEKSQLEDVQRLLPLIAILSVVAVWLLNLKLAAQTTPDAPVAEEALPQEAQEVLAHKVGQPPGGWTHLALLVAIAKLGGFLARKHDGTPGWQSIWRGWQRLMLIAEGVRLAREWSLKCG